MVGKARPRGRPVWPSVRNAKVRQSDRRTGLHPFADCDQVGCNCSLSHAQTE
jgi:hypothetical protein